MFKNISQTDMIDLEPRRSNIQEFYKDETVFITGATGFLGTLLVEKLLRCCPQVRKLILLIRNKRGHSAEERVRELFNQEIFDTMRLSNPNYHEKVDIVCGSLEEDNFGLSPNDIHLLTSQTSIVFHVAATVRFDEHIRIAYNINVKGTKTAISLARNMSRLKSFIHVSTAYCHCDRLQIDEKFYPPTFTQQELSTIISTATDDQLAIMNQVLLDKKPNSYTLTKSTAEDLIREVSGELPVCVFRPSIVFPTLKEPLPMWIKGFNGVYALSILAGIGLCRVILIDNDISLDFVPADLSINAMLSLPWYLSTIMLQEDKKIFNFVSQSDNRVLAGEFMKTLVDTAFEAKETSDDMVWIPSTDVVRNINLYYILFYVYHSGLALVVSLAEKWTNRKPRVLKIYRKLFTIMKLLNKFMLSEWTFENKNSQAMANALSPEDRIQFESSLSSFQWNSLFYLIPRSASIYMLNKKVTKEHYQNKVIYKHWADSIIRFSLKVILVYVVLSFLANQINFYFKK